MWLAHPTSLALQSASLQVCRLPHRKEAPQQSPVKVLLLRQSHSDGPTSAQTQDLAAAASFLIFCILRAQCRSSFKGTEEKCEKAGRSLLGEGFRVTLHFGIL